MKKPKRTTHKYGRYLVPQKWPSLGENNQMVVNNDLNNERDNISMHHGTLSKIDGERTTTEGNKFFMDYSKK